MISADVKGRPPAPTVGLVFLARRPSARFRRLVTAMFFAPPAAVGDDASGGGALVGVAAPPLPLPPLAEADGRVPPAGVERQAQKKIS
jgi:hypothetical protein